MSSKNKNNSFYANMFEKEHKECIDARKPINNNKPIVSHKSNKNTTDMKYSNNSYVNKTHHHNKTKFQEYLNSEAIKEAERYIKNETGLTGITFMDFLYFLSSGMFVDSIVVMKATLAYVGKWLFIIGGASIGVGVLNLIFDNFVR